jgi:hypothetical protein
MSENEIPSIASIQPPFIVRRPNPYDASILGNKCRCGSCKHFVRKCWSVNNGEHYSSTYCLRWESRVETTDYVCENYQQK